MRRHGEVIDKMTYRLIWVVKVTILLCFFSTEVVGADVSASLSSDVEYSDNISFRSDDKIDDVVHRLSLDVELEETRKDFQAEANFGVEGEHYYNESFADEASLTAGVGLFNFDLIESSLNWQSSFTRTEVITDTAESDTPDNQGYRDIIRSGPSFTYDLSRASRLILSANYISVENSDENASDSERANGRFVFVNTLNSVTELTFNSEYSESIDADERDEYQDVNINIGFTRRFTDGQLNFNFGRTKLIPENANSTSGNFYDVSLSRERVMWHSISVGYLQDISDTSIGFSNDEQGSAEEGAVLRTASTSDVVKRKTSTVSASRSLGAFNYYVRFLLERQIFVEREETEKTRDYDIGVGYQISSGLVCGFEYSLQLQDFADRAEIGKNKISNYRADTLYDLSRDLSVSTFIGFTSRTNTRTSSRAYEELSFGFGLNWEIL